MAKVCLGLLILVVGASAGFAGKATPAKAKVQTLPPIPLRPGAPLFIVILKDGSSQLDINRLLAITGVTNVKHQYASPAFYGFAADLTSLAQTLILADASVQMIGLNQAMTMQQGLAENWLALPNSEVAINQERIGATDGERVYKPAVVGVAILDTGIDLNDTSRFNVLDAKNCVNPGSPAQDDNGHGTFIAGTVAGKTNLGDGVFGVAPGSWLVSVKVIDSTGVVDFADAICGINWVGNWPAFFIKVASLAFSGPGADDGSCGSVNADALHVAICKATSHLGLTFVAAAGNQAQDFATIVPAAYDEVLTVTGMVDTDGLPGMRGPLPSCYIGEIDDRCAATISNYATTAADKLHTIAAPSLCVRGAAMGYNTTTTMSGTSMAVPHVVGTLAVCWGTLNNGYPGGWDSQRGPCWGQSSAWIRNYIISESANWNNANEDWGFLGDPNHWLSGAPLGAYYGYLVWAGGFFTG